MLCDRCIYDKICYTSANNDDDDRRALTYCINFCDSSPMIGELECQLKVMKQRYKQIGHTDGWYMGGAVMINILERRIAELKGEEWVPEYEKAVEAELKGE